jgi:hypothetical protein
MKNLIALAALLISTTSFAISESDSWSEIRAAVKADHKLSVSGDYAFVGQILSAFDVCTDGENFTSTKKLPVYKRQWVGRSRDNNDSERDGYTNVIVDYKFKSYPLETTQLKRECNNHGKQCTYVEVPFVQSIDKMITVKKFIKTVGSQDRKVYKTLFKKLYTVPACN